MKYELNEASPRYKEAKHILNLISKALGIAMNTLMSDSRQRHIVDARRICYVLLKEKMDLPAIVIGSYFNKDHANILHHLNNHDMLYKTYMDYRTHYDRAFKFVEENEYVEHDMYDCINSMLMRIELLEKYAKLYKDI